MNARRIFWQVTRWARALRFWLFLLLAVAAWLGFGAAQAQAQTTFPNCRDDYLAQANCPDRDVAYASARGSAVLLCQATYPHRTCSLTGNYRTGSSDAYVEAAVRAVSEGASSTVHYGPRRTWAVVCQGGGTWIPEENRCNQACADKPNMSNKSVRGSFSFCDGGCQYIQDSVVSVCLGDGADMYCGGSSWKPSGQSCQVGDGAAESWNAEQETCRSTGNGWNECVEPNGRHCVTGAKGTRMCWDPGTTGQRSDGATLEWADRVPPGETPQAPAHIENPVEQTNTGTNGQGPISGQSVGGSWTVAGGTGTANKGGQSDTGPGGTGKGKGGNGDGDEDGHGSPGEGVGDLYDSDETTIEEAFQAFRGRIQDAPIMAAGAGFLSVSVSGSCPAFTVPATYFWDAMSIDYHCSGPLADSLALGGALLMAIAAFIAWRAAFH